MGTRVEVPGRCGASDKTPRGAPEAPLSYLIAIVGSHQEGVARRPAPLHPSGLLMAAERRSLRGLVQSVGPSPLQTSQDRRSVAMSISFPGESAEYRAARERLLAKEIELRRAMEEVAVARRRLPPGGPMPEDYAFDALGSEGTPPRFGSPNWLLRLAAHWSSTISCSLGIRRTCGPVLPLAPRPSWSSRKARVHLAWRFSTSSMAPPRT